MPTVKVQDSNGITTNIELPELDPDKLKTLGQNFITLRSLGQTAIKEQGVLPEHFSALSHLAGPVMCEIISGLRQGKDPRQEIFKAILPTFPEDLLAAGVEIASRSDNDELSLAVNNIRFALGK